MSSWTRIEVDGLQDVEVRRPTLRDTIEGKAEDAWWWRCVRIGGQPATADQVLALDYAVAMRLAEEILKPRPTVPPKGGSGG